MKRLFTLLVVFSFVSLSFGQSMLIDAVRSTPNEDQKEAVKANGVAVQARTLTQNTDAAGPDLVVFIDGFVKQYYSVPLEQATISMEAMVGNIGDELTEPTNSNLTIGDTYDEDAAIPVPLGSGDDVTITFPPFTATEEGIASFMVTANASDDADPDNGFDVKNLTVDSEVLTRNNDNYLGNISIGSPGGIIGGTFEVLVEDVLSGVNFYLASATPGDIHQVVVYNFDGTPTTLVATAIDVLITAPNTYYTASFAEELTLSPGTYFVGIIEGANPMRLGHTTDDYFPMTAWVYYNGTWSPSEDYNFLHTHMINLEFGEWTAPLFDISLEEITLPFYMMPGDVTVSGILRNQSGEQLTSIDVTYTMNGGDEVMETFNINVGPLETYEFTFSNTEDLSAYGAYTFDVTISNPNGIEDENPDNDMLSHTTNVIEIVPVKRVFGEEATGTWCQWCPRGAVNMDMMAEKYPDTWIGVAVHNNDPMEDNTYDSGIGPLIPGYPSGLIDRQPDPVDPGNFEAAYNERINAIPPAAVSIESVMQDGNQLTFSVRADFVAQVSDLRFNAVIVEDNVTGTSSGYNQANAYSGGQNGPMGGYEDLPNPVPAADMVYNDVGRAILGGWEGTPGSLPETTTIGESYWHEYTVTLSSDWDVNELNIIGLLINNSTKMVENAVMSNDNTVGIFNEYNAATFSVYPNPAVDFMTIDAPKADRIEIINYMGQIMRVIEGTGRKVQIGVQDFDAGIYFIRVSENDEVSTKKVVIK